MTSEQLDTPIDLTLPRRCFYRTFAEHPGPCPSCGKSLHQSFGFYLVATRQGDRITDTLAMSGDMGWFCASCPTVVIDVNQVSERLQIPLPSWDVGGEFAVLGLVDLDAIPPEQAHLPLGEIDPLPLVSFEAVPDRKVPLPPRRPAKKKRPKRAKPTTKRRKKRKRRR